MLVKRNKAVEVLRLLDAAAIDVLLGQLPPEQSQSLRSQLASAASDPARARRRELVIEEFQRGLQLAGSSTAGPRLAIHHPPTDESQSIPFVSCGDPFTDLMTLNLHQVTQALEPESPRATAILLSRLSPERSAEILSLLPDSRRDAVVREINREQSTPESLAERMAAAVVARATDLPPEPPSRTGRVERMAAVLRAVPKPQRKKMLDAIREQDERTAELILQLLYTFGDLRSLPDRAVQKLLSEVDLALLATALAGMESEVVDKIMNNLSRRARSSLQEEMQFRGAPSVKEVEAARAQIAAVVARIDQEE
jgi:flagellar motor switch protein FliG